MTVQTLQLQNTTTTLSKYIMDQSGDKEERKREVGQRSVHPGSRGVGGENADMISVGSTTVLHRENSVC